MRLFHYLILLAVFSFNTVSANAKTFTNYGGFDTDGPDFAGMGRYAEAAPPWYQGVSAAPFPGWDENVQWDWSAMYTDAFSPVGDDPLAIAASFQFRNQGTRWLVPKTTGTESRNNIRRNSLKARAPLRLQQCGGCFRS